MQSSLYFKKKKKRKEIFKKGKEFKILQGRNLNSLSCRFDNSKRQNIDRTRLETSYSTTMDANQQLLYVHTFRYKPINSVTTPKIIPFRVNLHVFKGQLSDLFLRENFDNRIELFFFSIFCRYPDGSSLTVEDFGKIGRQTEVHGRLIQRVHLVARSWVESGNVRNVPPVATVPPDVLRLWPIVRRCQDILMSAPIHPFQR